MKKKRKIKPKEKTKRETVKNHTGVKEREPHIIPRIKNVRNTGIGLFIAFLLVIECIVVSLKCTVV
ncbi:MAG: hypothetical protein LUD77_05435 [Clostridiales bacterium]|nr:hypothetical protein [Clostridiales bacterium]